MTTSYKYFVYVYGIALLPVFTLNKNYADSLDICQRGNMIRSKIDLSLNTTS